MKICDLWAPNETATASVNMGCGRSGKPTHRDSEIRKELNVLMRATSNNSQPCRCFLITLCD